jgi:hypothetical protein
MAFEYGTQGATLDFPNPYRIENQFLALRGVVLLGGGLWLLLKARGLGAGAGQVGFVALIAAGALLIALALLEIAHAARQLRIYFGRGQPASLAPEIPREAEGASPRALALAETLRQGAIALATPVGPLNGVLYSLAPHLVTAPPELRRYLEVRFANLIAAAGLLLLYGVTMLLTDGAAARSLAAAVYVALGALLVVRTYLRGSGQGVVALKLGWLVALLVFAIVGTVLVGRVAGGMPEPVWLDELALPRIATVLLIAAVVIEALGLLAGRAHLDAPPPASTASEQVAVSFNADPNLLIQEVDRELQRRWTEGIPNRRYLWQTPKVDAPAGAGNFSGAVIEESQPMPPQAVKKLDWSTCLAFPRFSTLALMDLLGVLFSFAGVVLWARLAGAWVDGVRPPWPFASIGLICIVVGGYALRVAHQLWGRLDFESTITWLEFHGSWARAQVGLGAQWADRVRSERTVVNVESMTLRAWVVRARSVIFGYRDPVVGLRALVGMAGDVDAARAWTQQVRQFAAAQSMLVVPGAQADAERLQQLRGANQLAGTAPPVAIPPAPAPEPLPPAAAAAAVTRHCTHCGAVLPAGARFCGQCGTAVNSA